MYLCKTLIVLISEKNTLTTSTCQRLQKEFCHPFLIFHQTKAPSEGTAHSSPDFHSFIIHTTLTEMVYTPGTDCARHRDEKIDRKHSTFKGCNCNPQAQRDWNWTHTKSCLFGSTIHALTLQGSSHYFPFPNKETEFNLLGATKLVTG